MRGKPEMLSNMSRSAHVRLGGRWGSVVSSPSGVWGGAPAADDSPAFGLILLVANLIIFIDFRTLKILLFDHCKHF